MECMKMLGLLAVATVSLMAFAGTASATLTESAGDITDVNEPIHASSSGAIAFDGSVTISCQKSTVGGEISSAGGTSGPINTMSFTECGSTTIEVKNGGSFSIESIGGGKGTLKWTGTELTILTHSFFLGTWHCMYSTNNTHVGTVTGGSPATHSIGSAPLPITLTDSLCGEDMELTGSYTFTQPIPLLID